MDSLKDKRKPEFSGQYSDSNDNDSDNHRRNKNSGKARRRRKRSKVAPVRGRSISDMLDNCNCSENETANPEGTDISVTLKALSLLEQKIDKGFDELKERNAISINKIETQLQSVRTEFNHRMAGLTKKVEAKVTETILSNMNDKLKNVKIDIKKDVKRELSRELSKSDELESLRKWIEQVEGTVSDVLHQTSSFQSPDDITLSIVIRNLAESDSENTLNKVNALIKDGFRLRNISCHKAVRKTARGDNQKRSCHSNVW